MLEIVEFGMRNRSSPLAEKGGTVRLALNGEHLAPGRFVKRRGIDEAVTVNATVGVAKPFRLVPWKPAATAYLVAVGSDAIGFVNPVNGYFYLRTVAGGAYEDGAIWSAFTGGPPPTTPTVVAASWGLTPPSAVEPDTGRGARIMLGGGDFTLTPIGTEAWLYVGDYVDLFHAGDTVTISAGMEDASGKTLKNETGGPFDGAKTIVAGGVDAANKRVKLNVDITGKSFSCVLWALSGGWLGAGWYAYAATTWDDDRHVESQPTLADNLTPTRDGGMVAVTVTGVTGDTFRIYRNRGALTWRTSAAGAQGVTMLHNIAEETTGDSPDADILYNDYGRSAMGGVLTYANTTVPFYSHAHWFDGRVFYGDGQTVIYSNPACPETYAQTTSDGIDPILGFTEAGVVRGKAEIPVPADFGPITGFVSVRNNCLVLCEGGWWSIVRLPGMIGYGLNRGTSEVGCVSEATIAYGQGGVWWLSAAGVCFWDGINAPTVLTRDLIDPEDADTLFASDLSGASGAFDPLRSQYRVVVPKSGEGQFQLVLQTDRLPRELPISVWTNSATLAAIDGMGWDWSRQQIVYGFESGGVVSGKSEKAATYTEGTGDDTYLCTVEPWWLETTGPDGETKHATAVRVFVHREDTTTAQTVDVVVGGLRTTEELAGPAAVTLTWAKGEYEPKKISAQPTLGRFTKLTLTNEDSKPFEFRAVQIGSEKEISLAAGIP